MSDPDAVTVPNDRLIVFDTSLRDGEQSPGCSMTLAEKLEVARALDRLGVDVIEAGFPAASPGDLEAVKSIARTVRRPVIAGLARCHPTDILRAAEALRDAESARIHVFLATSPIHREHKLRLSTAQIVERVRDGVARAREHTGDVEFSAEDAARTEMDFLLEVVEAAIEQGATTINVPDTVGYSEPEEIGQRFRHLRETVRGADRVIWSAHCHDDLGLAVANSLAAVRAGARQVECTINGIGERAGNCALEELVMAIRARPDRYGVRTSIHTERLVPTSRLIAAITGFPVPPNKAVVGSNAFAHEAGIHQHGVIAHRETYEVLNPTDVGAAGSQLVLGKHSGRHALKKRLDELGHGLEEPAFGELFDAFKELADKKKEVTDADLEVLVVGRARADGPWELRAFSCTAGTTDGAHASVRVCGPEGEVIEAAVGDGPIDAAVRAIARATGFGEPGVLDFRAYAVGRGEDAQGQVTLTCDHEGRTFSGHGVSTDVVEASARAFLDVVNRCTSTTSSSETVAIP